MRNQKMHHDKRKAKRCTIQTIINSRTDDGRKSPAKHKKKHKQPRRQGITGGSFQIILNPNIIYFSKSVFFGHLVNKRRMI